MIWAQDRPQILQQAEGAMAKFIEAGPTQQRTSLGNLSLPDREVLHQLAGEYGLVTQSIGNGAQRSLVAFKPQNPGIFTQRVSEGLWQPAVDDMLHFSNVSFSGRPGRLQQASQHPETCA